MRTNKRTCRNLLVVVAALASGDAMAQGVQKPIADLLSVQTLAEWERARAGVLRGMQLVMGPLPDRANLPPLDVAVVATVAGEGFTRVTLTFAVAPGERVPAHLLLPDRPAGQRLPAMLALHQTTDLGKDEPAGLGGLANLHYGLELARRGYVVLAPDDPSFGEYPYDFDRQGDISGSMKAIANHLRCVDLLASRPEVDAARIGVIGHSLGGHNAMFVGVFDDRLRVVVSSCGWTPFHDYYGGNLAGWTSARYMPRLRTVYQLAPDQAPFDLTGVAAALAPRAFLSNSPTGDSNFSVAGVRKATPALRHIYRLQGVEDRLRILHPDCGHDFPPEVREAAYRFVDRVLKP